MTEHSIFADDGWQGFLSKLRAYVHRRVDPAWADDVVGDILLRLVRHRAGLQAASNPLAWMYTVAANALADHHRRRDAEHRALVRAGTEQAIIEASADGEDDAATSELTACMRPLLQGLPAHYGEALLLTEVEGLSQSEAAKRLGLSFSGMKSRVQRARSKLKDALLRCCAVELDRRGRVLGYAPAPEGNGSCGCSTRR
jgi:RNA polymerase sigma-70 factor (ECF subfamily)